MVDALTATPPARGGSSRRGGRSLADTGGAESECVVLATAPPRAVTTLVLHFYDSYMTDVAVSEARDHLAEAIEQDLRSGEPVFATRRGRGAPSPVRRWARPGRHPMILAGANVIPKTGVYTLDGGASTWTVTSPLVGASNKP